MDSSLLVSNWWYSLKENKEDLNKFHMVRWSQVSLVTYSIQQPMMCTAVKFNTYKTNFFTTSNTILSDMPEPRLDSYHQKKRKVGKEQIYRKNLISVAIVPNIMEVYGRCHSENISCCMQKESQQTKGSLLSSTLSSNLSW